MFSECDASSNSSSELSSSACATDHGGLREECHVSQLHWPALKSVRLENTALSRALHLLGVAHLRGLEADEIGQRKLALRECGESRGMGAVGHVENHGEYAVDALRHIVSIDVPGTNRRHHTTHVQQSITRVSSHRRATQHRSAAALKMKTHTLPVRLFETWQPVPGGASSQRKQQDASSVSILPT